MDSSVSLVRTLWRVAFDNSVPKLSLNYNLRHSPHWGVSLFITKSPLIKEDFLLYHAPSTRDGEVGNPNIITFRKCLLPLLRKLRCGGHGVQIGTSHALSPISLPPWWAVIRAGVYGISLASPYFYYTAGIFTLQPILLTTTDGQVGNRVYPNNSFELGRASGVPSLLPHDSDVSSPIWPP